MTAPAFIVTPYYDKITGITDVQSIMDRLSTILPAIGWTESPAGTFRTPTDGAGRWYKVALVRSTALLLLQTMTDDYARASTQRGMAIAGAGETIEFYYGTQYLYIINSSSVSKYDFMWSSLLSLSPESEVAHNAYCVCGEGKNSGGSQSATVGMLQNIAIPYGYYDTITGRINFPNAAGYVNNPLFITPTGARRWVPYEVVGMDIVTAYGFRGKLYNALLGSSSYPFGTVYPVPIDEASSASFKVLDMVSQWGLCHAVRIP